MKAWELLTPPGTWVPGPGLAIDTWGLHCKARSPYAIQWSLAGALNRCYIPEPDDGSMDDAMSTPWAWHKQPGYPRHMVCQVVKMGMSLGMSPEAWQSLPGRTQDDVVRLLKEFDL